MRTRCVTANSAGFWEAEPIDDGSRSSDMQARHTGRIDGYAIISEDGMLADAQRVMPAGLKFDADKRFFERGMDSVAVVVHGRHSQEQFARSAQRHRLIVTSRVAALEPHRSNSRALWWNPAGAAFEAALAQLGMLDAPVGVIGGPDVFALFLDRFDLFHLTRAPDIRLPGGIPVFPEVPGRTPEDVLASHGMIPGPVQHLDPERGLTLVSWRQAD
jgi:hypothetical protein